MVFSKKSAPITRLDEKTGELEKKLKQAQKSSQAVNKTYLNLSNKIADLQKQMMSADPQKMGDMMKTLTQNSSELALLAQQNYIEAEKVRMLEKQVEDYKAASKNLKGLTAAEDETVDAFQRYVAQVERVLIRYGVRDDGELIAKGLDEANMDMAHENAYKAYEAVVQGQEKNK